MTTGRINQVDHGGGPRHTDGARGARPHRAPRRGRVTSRVRGGAPRRHLTTRAEARGTQIACSHQAFPPTISPSALRSQGMANHAVLLWCTDLAQVCSPRMDRRSALGIPKRALLRSQCRLHARFLFAHCVSIQTSKTLDSRRAIQGTPVDKSTVYPHTIEHHLDSHQLLRLKFSR
jgi:hypothetical protein